MSAAVPIPPPAAAPRASVPKRPLSEVDPSIANAFAGAKRRPKAPKPGPVYAVVRETEKFSARGDRRTKKDLGIYENLHAANLACLTHKDVVDSVEGWSDECGVGLIKGMAIYMDHPDTCNMTRVFVEKRKRLEGCTYNAKTSSEEEVRRALEELEDDDHLIHNGEMGGPQLGQLDFVVGRHDHLSRRRRR